MSRAIILGGGFSINRGIKLGLKQLIEHEFVIGTNISFRFFNPTLVTFVDIKFWERYKEEIKKLPLVICKKYTDISKTKNIFPVVSKSDYPGKGSFKRGIYRSVLTGLFSIHVAINLGATEIRLCFDDKTEVFTDEGWKLFKDLRGNEKILTRKNNGDIEWSNIWAQQKYYYKGKMNKIKSHGIDLLTTPNHRFVLENRKKEINFKTVHEFTHDDYIPRTFNWIGKDIKYFVFPNNKKIKVPMKSWVKFLGLYLSEGCCCIRKDRKRSYTVMIYQNHNEEKDKYIEAILKKLPFNYSKHKRGWEVYSVDLVDYLKPLGLSYQKYIPHLFKQLSKNYLKVLLDSLIFGDGRWDKRQKEKNTGFYWTTSKQLADDIQEIIYKCGYYANMAKRKGRICKISPSPKLGRELWSVWFNKSQKQGNISHINAGSLISRKHITQQKYTGFVYDITVKNHTLFVRHNNVCCWSGNCGFDWSRTVDKNKDNKGNHLVHYFQNDKTLQNYDKLYSVSYYDNHSPRSLFEPFEKEKGVTIINVCPESHIPNFKKITYVEFLKELKNNPQFINQDKKREEIRKKLEQEL